MLLGSVAGVLALQHFVSVLPVQSLHSRTWVSSSTVGLRQASVLALQHFSELFIGFSQFGVLWNSFSDARSIGRSSRKWLFEMLNGFSEQLPRVNNLLWVHSLSLAILVAKTFEIAASLGHELATNFAQPFESVIMRDGCWCCIHG